MAILDLDNFNFCGDQITALGQLLYDDFEEYSDIRQTLTVYTGIVVDKQIGFITEGGLVGVKNQGCNPDPQDYSIGTRTVNWSPKAWEILISECWTDLEGTAAALGLRTAVNRPDLIGTVYMSIIFTILSRDVREFWWRLAWFNDTDAENVSSGGVITDGVPTQYFDILDGLWKKIFALTASDHVEITANQGATYEDQEITAADALATLRSMHRKASSLLKSQRDAKFALTRGMYDAYVDYLSGVGCDCSPNIEFMNRQENGVSTVKYKGYPVMVVDEWSRIIEAYEDNGTTYNLPNRALFYVTRALGFGVDATNSFSLQRVWYEKKERRVYVEMMGMADTAIINDKYIVAAY